jgi:NDP-sugar pyrophosphorylase family protein
MTAAGIRHAVILAAGRGIRMAPLTEAMPKAMAPYQGTTLIAHGIDQLRSRIDHIHITVGYKGAMLARHVIEHGVASVFNTNGHGNAWWLSNTFLSLLDEPVLVLTCDNVTELDLKWLGSEYVRRGQPACMLVPVLPIAGLDGDFVFHEDGIVTRVSRDDPAPTYCSGIQVINPTRIRALVGAVEDFGEVWRALIPLGELRASQTYPKRWFAIDTMQQLADRDQRVANRAR